MEQAGRSKQDTVASHERTVSRSWEIMLLWRRPPAALTCIASSSLAVRLKPHAQRCTQRCTQYIEFEIGSQHGTGMGDARFKVQY